MTHRMPVLTALAALAVVGLAGPASAALITFENVATGEYGDDGSDAAADLTVDGFEFEGNEELVIRNDGDPGRSLITMNWGNHILIRTESGDPFEINGVSMQSGWSQDTSTDAIVTGTYAAGGTIDRTLSVEGGRVYRDFQFNDDWQGLSEIKLDFSGGAGNGYGDLDNFDLVVIPEPASLALLGLGGALAFGRRIRRKV